MAGWGPCSLTTARRRFSRVFWYPEGGYLYDVVDGEKRDASVRPNQLLALSLPFPLLTVRQRRQVLRVVEARLLTPAGLRSLAPEDAAYRSHYDGGPERRDSAYHQGTVWVWLLGPFATALVRERGVRGMAQGHVLLERVLVHLGDAGVGTCSEIFDGDGPHASRGAIAQAWSVERGGVAAGVAAVSLRMNARHGTATRPPPGGVLSARQRSHVRDDLRPHCTGQLARTGNAAQIAALWAPSLTPAGPDPRVTESKP